MTKSPIFAGATPRRLLITAAVGALLAPLLICGATYLRCAALRDAQLRLMDEVGPQADAVFEFDSAPPPWAPWSWFPEDSVRVSDSAEYQTERGSGWTTAFDQVTDVVLSNVQESKAVARLADCASLRTIWTFDADFRPQGWAALTACRQVETLFLDDARIEEVDLALLRNLANLKQLDLGRTGATDDRLAFLAELGKLNSLTLSENPVTGAFFQGRGELASLTHLAIHHTALDDAGAARIAASCPRLTRLHAVSNPQAGPGFGSLGLAPCLTDLELYETAVDDAALVGIARSTSIVRLMVDRSKVTGKGLLPLARIPSLRFVWVDHHAMDRADLDAFVRLRPDVEIPGFHPPPTGRRPRAVF